MTTLFRTAAIALAMVLTPLSSASSPTDPLLDEVVLKDGSRIVGKVIAASADTIDVKTGFAGTLTIDFGLIEKVETKAPQLVQLQDGTVLRDLPFTVENEQLVIAPQTSDQQRYALSEILKVNPEPWELGQGRQWAGLVSFAWAMERGNSDTDKLNYLLDTYWRAVEDRYTLRINGQLDEANGVSNAENWNILGKYDYFMRGNHYWGANLSLEADDFTDLNLRAYFGPYYGIQWYQRSVFSLSTEFGLTYVDEDFIVAEDKDYPGANWNIDVSSDYLGGGSRLFLNQVGIWNLDEPSDVIVNTRMGLSFPLLGHLEAAAEILLDYDSGAVAGVKELDETYNFRIGYSW